MDEKKSSPASIRYCWPNDADPTLKQHMDKCCVLAGSAPSPSISGDRISFEIVRVHDCARGNNTERQLYTSSDTGLTYMYIIPVNMRRQPNAGAA